MKLPIATYRLQFRGGMDFAKAAATVPYLRDLGVSHLYASPIFTAPRGSTHGYDVADHNEIDPVLGGRAGFERLVETLRAAGMGVILDIVPNHMAASLQNPWWRSVVEWGRESPFAGHFDIDWQRRLTLPVLGRPYAEALAERELRLDIDLRSGSLALCYFDELLPLHPSTWAQVLEAIRHPVASDLIGLAAQASPAAAGEFHRRVRSMLRDVDTAALAAELRAASQPDLVAAVQARQPWEVTFWKDARKSLSYRRFFEVTGLAGVRVDQPEVFDDVHRLTLDLVRSGLVDGLRIDHVDGLADPHGYLRRLRAAAGPDVYIVVEKILARDERLSDDWPIQGTTGYEFIDALAGLLVDPAGVSRLSSSYEALTGSGPSSELRMRAKRQIATINFEGEVSRLAMLLGRLVADGMPVENIRLALVELLVAMPVYRVYNQGNASGQDRAVLDRALRDATKTSPELETVLAHVHALLAGDHDASSEALEARERFQQLSGPVMAKSVEDTLFYRDHRFIALNEVGSDPVDSTPTVADFHASMTMRAASARHALSTTATHDTKRGEDARARLLALSEMPDAWIDAVKGWRERTRDRIVRLPNDPAPETEVEWLIFQALAAVWPSPRQPEDDLDDLRERFLAYLEKSLREAKQRTDWGETDADYEAAVKSYAAALFDDKSFIGELATLIRPLALAGWRNSLAQTAVKLLAPGVPDIYQGSEAADFSFVDPDNRRAPDFTRLAADLQRDDARSFPSIKQKLVRTLLGLRREMPTLFSEGDYLPLEVAGPRGKNLAAFTRRHAGRAVVAVLPRLTLALLGPDGEIAPDIWRGTTVLLPQELRGRELKNALTGRVVYPREHLDAEAVLSGPLLAMFVAAA